MRFEANSKYNNCYYYFIIFCYILYTIIYIVGSLLVFFDQHAVHERIRLEALTEGNTTL